VFGLAPAMVASRTGNRTRVLAYLLELAGLDVELALARSYAGDSTEADLADDDTYQNLVVRIGDAENPTWLHAGSRGAPFGYVPPVLAGMDALVLNESADRVRIAERPLEADLRTVEVDVQLADSGGARVSVVETFRGSGAVLWRDQLEGIPEANLEDQFESAYVSSFLPGGRLARLVITGREERESPLVLRYEVELESLARGGQSGLVLPPIYRARLGPQYAPVASRTTAQLIDGGLALDVIVRVRPPDGTAIAAAPGDVSLDGPGGARVRMSSERSEGGIEMRRVFRIPRMRVAPDAYPELARFARAVDEAESAEVAFRR
jgi:hypothetical protein